MAVSVLLLVHDDPDVLDWLTTLFEANGFEVIIGATALAAHAKLERTEVSAILAGWDVGGGAGEKLYDWALTHKPSLLRRFLVLADNPEHEQIAAERDLVAIASTDYESLLHWVQEADKAPLSSSVDFELVTEEPIAVLIVDGDPRQTLLIRDILSTYGFVIKTASNAQEAIDALEKGLVNGSIEVILSEWHLENDGGEQLYQWLVTHHPNALDRCLFISGGSLKPIRELTPEVACYAKGQDSKIIVAAITRAARHGREPSVPPANRM